MTSMRSSISTLARSIMEMGPGQINVTVVHTACLQSCALIHSGVSQYEDNDLHFFVV